MRSIDEAAIGKDLTTGYSYMLKAGTSIAAGVTPGKAGAEVHGVRVYGSVRLAV
jgi:succinyl-CoA synthetase alpha subunit